MFIYVKKIIKKCDKWYNKKYGNKRTVVRPREKGEKKMKLFDELVGEIIEGIETAERLEVCNALLLKIQENSERGLPIKNNNLELATMVNTSQVEAKQVKKILEANELIEIVKEEERESSIILTTKGSFYVAKLKTKQLKEAMTTTSDPNSEDFVDYEMDLNFVEVYNHLSYQERVVYEATVAATLCREQYQACYFRTLGSLLDAQAAEIMPVLSALEDKGLVALVGEKSTKIYLTNSREFLLTHYGEFHNTGFVKNDYVYKAAFHYDEFSGYAAPYEFPDFEVIYSTDEELGASGEEEVEMPHLDIETQPLSTPQTPVATAIPEHHRVFLIDTASVSLEHFVQITAVQTLTDQDYYIAMLSPASTGGSMSFTLFNHLMKLPCRGETEMVEDLALYYQFFTIKIVQAIQEYPASTVVVLTNDPGYPAIAQQLQAKLKLRDHQVQVMNQIA